jgi:hypothetical protein
MGSLGLFAGRKIEDYLQSRSTADCRANPGGGYTAGYEVGGPPIVHCQRTQYIERQNCTHHTLF